MSAAPMTRTALDAAVSAGIEAREAAERACHRSRAERSRAADALERTAQRRGCDEAERERLRAAYASADRAVAACQAELERAREVENAWRIVAQTVDGSEAEATPIAALSAPATPRRHQPSAVEVLLEGASRPARRTHPVLLDLRRRAGRIAEDAADAIQLPAVRGQHV